MAPQTWVVQNCSDAAPGSLRDIIQNPANAQSGDTVDLSHLPMLCGVVDSTISLTTGEIAINQAALTLVGPDASVGSVTISGGGASRVLKHVGSGTLSIRGLAIADGYAHGAGNTYGGCVSDTGMGAAACICTRPHSRNVMWSAIRAPQEAERFGRAVTSRSSSALFPESMTSAQMMRSYGGGIHANNLSANYSSIQGNVAEPGQLGGSIGGGAYATEGITIFRSTVDHNRASYVGGLLSRAASMLVDSTLSDNTADIFCAGWYQRGGSSLSIWNSTIAFNHANADTAYGAVTFAVVLTRRVLWISGARSSQTTLQERIRRQTMSSLSPALAFSRVLQIS